MLNLGLPRLQALDTPEGDGDGRASLSQIAPGEPGNNGRGSYRDQPNPAEELRARVRSGLLGMLITRSFVSRRLSHSGSATTSHMSRESKTMVANMVMITTAANATRPGPTCTAVNAPNCRTATSTETEKISMLDQRPIVSIVRYSRVLSVSKTLERVRV